MKLSSREKTVLAYFEQRANCPVSAAALELGMRVNVVHYILKKLQQQGIIIGRAPLVDAKLLGQQRVITYFSAYSFRAGGLTSYINALKSHPRVIWLACIGGRENLVMEASIEGLEQLEELTNKLATDCGVSVEYRRMATIRQFISFGRKYLSTQHTQSLSWGQDSGKTFTIDAVDRDILERLSSGVIESTRETAKNLKLPHSTVERRITGMEKKGIIRGYLYRFKLEDQGAQRYKLQLVCRKPTSNFYEQFVKYVQRHVNLTHLIFTAGQWDLDLNMEVSTGREAAHIADKMRERFFDNIAHTNLMPILDIIHYKSF